MKAAVVAQTGLEIREVPAPVPGRNHVLVRVRACGLNRADLGVAAGHMHGSVGGPGTIVGMEFAGEVVEVGAEVSAVKPGAPAKKLTIAEIWERGKRLGLSGRNESARIVRKLRDERYGR